MFATIKVIHLKKQLEEVRSLLGGEYNEKSRQLESKIIGTVATF